MTPTKEELSLCNADSAPDEQDSGDLDTCELGS
jgi:hypothetical protein